MYCDQCGSPLGEGIKFCTACGAVVKQPPVKHAAEAGSSSSRVKRLWPLWVVLGIIGVIALIPLARWATTPIPPSEAEQQEFIAKQGEPICEEANLLVLPGEDGVQVHNLGECSIGLVEVELNGAWRTNFGFLTGPNNRVYDRQSLFNPYREFTNSEGYRFDPLAQSVKECRFKVTRLGKTYDC